MFALKYAIFVLVVTGSQFLLEVGGQPPTCC